MLKTAEMIYSNPDSEPQGGKTNNLVPFINYSAPAPKRSLDMLLDKYYGREYQSEVIMVSPEKAQLPVLRKKLRDSSIMLVTDGGLVPRGNPDRIPSTSSDRFGIYSLLGVESLSPMNYEISHQGYDNSFVEADPNRLLPVDALRELEREGIIGKLYDVFLSTTGVMTSTEKSKQLGKEIAAYAASHPVDAVLITSACGTSTRCGAYIGLAVEARGIPAVQITNLTKIASDTGLTKVLRGSNVCYPFGAPSLPAKGEYLYRKELVSRACRLLAETAGL